MPSGSDSVPQISETQEICCVKTSERNRAIRLILILDYNLILILKTAVYP